jgi:hypothetical protein
LNFKTSIFIVVFKCQIQFHTPTHGVKIRQVGQGINLGVQQRRDKRDRPGSEARSADLVAKFTHRQRRRQGRVLFLGHPFGTLLGLEPLDHLIEHPLAPKPTRSWKALVVPRFRVRRGVRPIRCEVDDLPLVHAKHRENAAFAQHRQMSVRAKCTVSHESIARFECRMNLVHAGHFVGTQGGGLDLQKYPGSSVKQRQDFGHRKPATGPLIPGLAESFLEFGDVGHGERGAVGQERSMPMPRTFGFGVRDQGFDQAVEHGLKDSQWQQGASHAIGHAGETTAPKTGDMLQRGIAMQHLNHEPMNDRDRVEDASSPGMPNPPAGGMDRFGIEPLGDVLPKLLENGINPVMHHGVSWWGGVVDQNTIVPGDPFLLKMPVRLDLPLA